VFNSTAPPTHKKEREEKGGGGRRKGRGEEKGGRKEGREGGKEELSGIQKGVRAWGEDRVNRGDYDQSNLYASVKKSCMAVDIH
jgi:hypothetical protein